MGLEKKWKSSTAYYRKHTYIFSVPLLPPHCMCVLLITHAIRKILFSSRAFRFKARFEGEISVRTARVSDARNPRQLDGRHDENGKL